MADREKFSDPTEIRYVIGANGTFSLHSVSGSIRLRGSDTDEVHVVARSSHGREESLPLIVRRSEGGLHIEVEQRPFQFFGRSMFSGHDGIDFDVALPRAARVEVNAVSADIDTRALNGEQDYKTVSGDAMIDSAGGRLSLATVSGDIRLTADEPLEPRISTTSGDVAVSTPQVKALQVRTVSGDTELRAGFDTGAIHTVESVSGDLAVTSSSGLTVDVRRGLDMSNNGARQLVAGDGSARLKFRSLSGDVHLDGAGIGQSAAPTPIGARQMDGAQASAAPAAPAASVDSLEILRALERGEIDVEEASRRLEGAGSRG